MMPQALPAPLFQAAAWFINDLLNVHQAFWAGFLIVFGFLIALAGIAGSIGLRWINVHQKQFMMRGSKAFLSAAKGR